MSVNPYVGKLKTRMIGLTQYWHLLKEVLRMYGDRMLIERSSWVLIWVIFILNNNFLSWQWCLQLETFSFERQWYAWHHHIMCTKGQKGHHNWRWPSHSRQWNHQAQRPESSEARSERYWRICRSVVMECEWNLSTSLQQLSFLIH